MTGWRGWQQGHLAARTLQQGGLAATAVVVGAGPAGLAAARAAAGAGVPVVLIDAAPWLGGQYHRQDALAAATIRPPHGVEHLAETAVVGLEPLSDGHRLHLRTGPADGPGRAARHLDARALVLATGAHDRALPFPGWDLPGVTTAGAAQALAKGQRLAVGRRVLVSGSGPFLFPVARSLLAVGARVVAVLEANDPRVHPGLVAGYRKAPELIGHLAALTRHGVPYRMRHTVIAAHGRDRVEGATIARLTPDWGIVPGSERRIDVDAVCVGFGFTPRLELAVAAGCALVGGFVAVDARQATSVPGVFAAGELTGIGGAALAAAEGAVAGAAAARLLGAAVAVPHIALRRVRAGRRFAAALASAYAVAPGWQQRLPAETLVCRCEEVTAGELLAALADRDARGVRALKLASRAGLGMCQGRICGVNVAELAGIPCAATAFANRPIVEPLRLGELATTEEEQR